MNTDIPVADAPQPTAHIEFELRPVEDREASSQAGRKIMADKEFALIYPRGGKDKVVKSVPPAPKPGDYQTAAYHDFMAKYGKQYEAWKAGQDIPVEGTDLRVFPLLTPAQIENCRTYHIYTVEQLAEANEEALKNIGMGSRNLKMTAQRWLDFGDKEGGKEVARIEALETSNEDLREQIKVLTAKLEEKTNKRKKKDDT